jgi:hypothetical protein
MFLIDVNPAKNENVVDTELKATDKGFLRLLWIEK